MPSGAVARPMLSTRSVVMNIKTTTALVIALAVAGTVAAAPITVRMGEVNLAFDSGRTIAPWTSRPRGRPTRDQPAATRKPRQQRSACDIRSVHEPRGIPRRRAHDPLRDPSLVLCQRTHPADSRYGTARFLEIMNERWQRDPSLDIEDANKRIRKPTTPPEALSSTREPEKALRTTPPWGPSQGRGRALHRHGPSRHSRRHDLHRRRSDGTYPCPRVPPPILPLQEWRRDTAHALVRSLQPIMHALIARNDPDDTPSGDANTVMDKVMKITDGAVSAGVVGFASAIALLIPAAVVVWIRSALRRRRARTRADAGPGP